MKKVLTKKQAQFITNFIDNDDRLQIYKQYSGRFMYGEVCFGITTNQFADPAGMVMQLATFLHSKGEIELASDLSNKIRTDSLGRGFIVYFPGYQWPENGVKQ